jgi:hypothetical protein
MCVCVSVVLYLSAQNFIVMCPICQYHVFFTLTHKRQDSAEKKVNKSDICVLLFSTTFV